MSLLRCLLSLATVLNWARAAPAGARVLQCAVELAHVLCFGFPPRPLLLYLDVVVTGGDATVRIDHGDALVAGEANLAVAPQISLGQLKQKR